jgi:hypothetical protein
MAAKNTPVSKAVDKGDETVKRDDVQGTIGPVEPAEKPFISEGVRNDILLHGSTIDPLTGKTLTKADL